MRRYLAEFLSDRRVVKLPRLLWLPILHGIVLRRRPAESAEKYASIWMAEGSPLAVYTARQAHALRRRLGIPVEYAMRYGEPAIAPAIERLKGCALTVLPLYPQYSESTTESVADVLPRVDDAPAYRFAASDSHGTVLHLKVGEQGHYHFQSMSASFVINPGEKVTKTENIYWFDPETMTPLMISTLTNGRAASWISTRSGLSGPSPLSPSRTVRTAPGYAVSPAIWRPKGSEN